MNIGVSVIIHQIDHVTADFDKVRYDSIVHEGVSTEDKRMVVDRSHRGSCSGTNVGEDGFAGRVRADTAKVGVMKRRLSVLVEGRVLCIYAIAIELCRRGSVPYADFSVSIASSG